MNRFVVPNALFPVVSRKMVQSLEIGKIGEGRHCHTHSVCSVSKD